MGYRVADTCYPTTTEALEGFNSQYPQTVGAGNSATMFVLYPSASSINGTGLITFSIKNSANTVVITNGTEQLQTCDSELYGFGAYPIQSIIFIATCLILFALGWANGHRR